MWQFARRVTTKVTTVVGNRKRSNGLKPKLRVVSITQLVLDEKNANKGTKRGRELLGNSLEKYGAGRSVVVDRHNRVIAGNKTVEAAVAAGMKSIAVIETDGSSLVAVQRGDLDLKKDKKARELAIADNRVGELDLEWNPEVLASLDVDLKQFWNENELNALLKDFRSDDSSAPEPKIDQAAELQKKWKTERGQFFRLEAGKQTEAQSRRLPNYGLADRCTCFPRSRVPPPDGKASRTLYDSNPPTYPARRSLLRAIFWLRNASLCVRED
jgi:hypothetical protein